VKAKCPKYTSRATEVETAFKKTLKAQRNLFLAYKQNIVSSYYETAEYTGTFRLVQENWAAFAQEQPLKVINIGYLSGL